MTATKTTVGIRVLSVDVAASTVEESDGWLRAEVEIVWEQDSQWTGRAGGAVRLLAGVYADGTRDDHDSWCQSDEGERALAMILGLPEHGQRDRCPLRVLLPDLCESLGSRICDALIEECAPYSD